MKIDFKSVILNADGKPIPLPITNAQGVRQTPSDNDPSTTLRTLAEQALFNSYPDEQNLAVDKKLARYQLFCKISKADLSGTQDLTSEEVVLLKFVIGKSYNALFVGRAFDIIEPSTEDV